MTNGGIIEGTQHRCGVSACAKVIDLSPTTSFPNGSMRVFHGAGTTDEEIAGQHSNTASPFSIGVAGLARSGEMHGLLACKELQSLPHCSRNLGNPYVEKEARLRPQLNLSFGGGAGLNNQGNLWRN